MPIKNHWHCGIADHVDRVENEFRHWEPAAFSGNRRDHNAQQRADKQRLMQRLLQNLPRGDLAFGGRIEHGQADRCEHRLLHDQNRRDQSGIAQNVRGDRQTDVVGVQIQRIQRADGGIRRLRWKNSLLRIRNTNPTSTAEKNATTMEEWNISKILSLDRMANIRHGLDTKKAEPVEHHLRGRSAYAHARGHVTGADDDANDAEAFQMRLKQDPGH
mgnify:CR=1 FL=1